MPKGILFIGGAGPEPGQIRKIIKSGDLVCAADSGLDAAMAAGVRPDGIVGDMDSISDPALLGEFPPGVVEKHPVDKDETDTELGIRWLKRGGCRRISIIGGGEGRLDHTLALKALFGRQDAPDRWFTAREVIERISRNVIIRGKPESGVSFVSVGPGPWKLKSMGLIWELTGLDWDFDTVSLSNRLSGISAEITVQSGEFLMIRPIGDVLN